MSTLICVDNGGTLTDAIAVRNGRFYRAKAITTPHDLSQCFIESITALSNEIYGAPEPERLLAETELIRYSTTQGTNALVQARDKGPRLGLLLSEGTSTSALLKEPGEHAIFADLVGERVACIGETINAGSVIESVNSLLKKGCDRIVLALDGDDRAAREIEFRRHFLRCFPRHFLGAVPLLLAHQLTDDDSIGRRAWTALFNAFLHPAMEHFLYHAEGELRQRGMTRPLMVFRNDGNASRVAKTVALKTYSSGPRGGMEGVRAYSRAYGGIRTVSFDVGGTTTDIGVATTDQIDEQRHGLVEGVATSIPLCHILSVGVGGSSVLSAASGRIQVGPQSVGGSPGPACFGRGGKQATITDVYLASGWFDPSTYFGGRLRIDAELATQAVLEHVGRPAGLELDTALLALDEAYHRVMSDAITAHAGASAGSMLMAIGGAGPMSACRVAELAQFDTVIVPHAAPVFCAYGIGFSDLRYVYEAQIADDPEETRDVLMQRARRDLFAEGFDLDSCEIEHTISNDGKQVRLEAVRRLRSFPVADIAAVSPHPALPTGRRRCLLPDGTRRDLPLHDMARLEPGACGDGPAVLEDTYATVRVLPGWRFEVTGNRDLLLRRCGQ
ncbi:hypothetical protein WL93_24080 [Burkholderia diffusa]|uniref:hydantoinase/oxoprolinase family protein n=1 Tax=Burkholderia diffusa TaxID=488732 RepID=UPI0007596DFE|nr:hydantoinase/oxoprolinase family protein [Burkholderia diffusa]KWF80452.1 hypothetical protein WL93_24080 [Burkholderia diffusa]